MIVKGYKAFNKDKTNRYGIPFKEKITYKVSGPLTFGNMGNGIHFCKRLEDTLRYFPALEEDIAIAEVTSSHEILEYFDDYYAYYDMYVGRYVKIEKFLSRQEIIEMFLNLPEYRVARFVKSFRLKEEEKKLFRKQYENSEEVLNAIAYYQEDNKDIYSKKYVKTKKETL